MRGAGKVQSSRFAGKVQEGGVGGRREHFGWCDKNGTQVQTNIFEWPKSFTCQVSFSAQTVRCTQNIPSGTARCTRTCTIPHICGTIGLRQTRYAKWCLPVFACLTSCPRVLLVFFCTGVLAPRAENVVETIHSPPSFLLRWRFKVQTVCVRSNSVSLLLYVTRVHTLIIQPYARVLVV